MWDGQIVAIASRGDEMIAERVDAGIRIPDLGEFLTAIVATLPVQCGHPRSVRVSGRTR